jgi:Putative phage tail protein
LRLSKLLNAIALLIALTATAHAEPISGIISVLYVLSEILTALIVVGVSVGLNYLVGVLTRPKPGEAPQREISITTAEEGVALARIYGSNGANGQMGVGPHCIDRGSVTVRSQGGSSGGKKTPGVAGANAYSMSLGFAVCENIDDTVLGVSRIWIAEEEHYFSDPAWLDGTNPPIVDGGNNFIKTACNAQRMQILLGQSTQTTRCSWATVTGDDAPAYRGVVTIWFDNMDLEPTHTLLPQMKVEVVTTADVYTYECLGAGLTLADLDFDTSLPDGASNATAQNIFVLGPTPPKQTFQMLNVVNPFSIVEADGKLKGFYLPTASSATITDGELGAISKGREEVTQDEDKPPKFVMSSEQTTDTPRRVILRYYDPARAYEIAVQGAAREYGSGHRVLEYNLNMALARENVEYIAARALGRMESERESINEVLLPKRIQYHPGDTLTLPLPNGQMVDARIETMEIGPGEPVTIVATRQLRLAGLGAGDGSNSTTPPVPPDDGLPILSVFVLSNVPPLIDDDDGFDGIYWTAGPSVDANATAPPARWNGGVLIRNACGSDDTHKQYYAVATTNTAGIIGVAKTTLADGSGVDTTNTVDISFPYGDGTTTLTGIHDDAFNATTVANLCVLGGEVFQFRDISDESGSYPAGDQPVYRLSHLKRALRDTAAFTSTHTSSDAFFLYDPNAVIRVPLNIDEQDNTWSFKSLTSGEGEVDIDNPLAFTVDADAGDSVLHVHVHT